MRILLTLTACFAFAACADHRGDLIVANETPQTPVNQPDSGGGTTSSPSNPAGESSSQVSTGGTTSGGSNSGGTTGGEVGQSTGNGNGGGNGGSPGGGNPPSGPEGSQPVPEPSTLILVGTGLAGATLLRRRKKSQPEA